VEWHVETLVGSGLRVVDHLGVATPRMGYGANRNARVQSEAVVVLVAP